MIWPGSLLCGICALQALQDQRPRVTAEERAFVEESTQVLHFLNELADIDGPRTPLKMLLGDACLTLRELVYP